MVERGTVAWTICPDVFRTIDNIHACPCPVHLIQIHGELDRLIPPQHSQNLHARHRKKTTLHIIDGDHNNLDFGHIGGLIATLMQRTAA